MHNECREFQLPLHILVRSHIRGGVALLSLGAISVKLLVFVCGEAQHTIEEQDMHSRYRSIDDGVGETEL